MLIIVLLYIQLLSVYMVYILIECMDVVYMYIVQYIIIIYV